MKIAFFGAGLMGTGFVRRLRAQGVEVNVWNRTAARAKALEAHGAVAFEDPRAAIAGVDRIHLSLADDASVDAALEPLAEHIAPAVWIVDHTTTAVTPTQERVARWNGRGRTYVHAPVFMAPVNALEGTGLMLVSGEASRHEALLPALKAMTGQVVYLGEEPQRAAAFKLFGNLTLIGISGVLADVNRLAHAVGISTEEAFSLFQHFNPGQTLPARAARIATGDLTKPSFELNMARKDVRLMIEEAQRGGMELTIMSAVAARMDAAIARGDGALDAAIYARIPAVK
jgi:3-hydroxyisobutyrate dehydrogenase